MNSPRINRFTKTTTPGTDSILTGITDSIDPRFNIGYVKRNLAPFKRFLPPKIIKNPRRAKAYTDAQLRNLATKAVFGVEHIHPKGKK